MQRTFAAARSVEFDALLIAGAPGPGKDARAVRDAKAANGKAAMVIDPRILLMLHEAYRHAKPLGGWGDAATAFDVAGIATDAPGIVIESNAVAVLGNVTELLTRHRVWERFPAT